MNRYNLAIALFSTLGLLQLSNCGPANDTHSETKWGKLKPGFAQSGGIGSFIKIYENYLLNVSPPRRGIGLTKTKIIACPSDEEGAMKNHKFKLKSNSGAPIDISDTELVGQSVNEWNNLLGRSESIDVFTQAACPKNVIRDLDTAYVEVRSLDTCDNSDFLAFTVKPDKRRYEPDYYVGAKITLCLNKLNGIYGEEHTRPVVLHEMGHAFGLCDQYHVEDIGGHPNCDEKIQSEVPAVSIMDAVGPKSQITADDRLGIRLLSCLDLEKSMNKSWLHSNPQVIAQFQNDTYEIHNIDGTTTNKTFLGELNRLEALGVKFLPECSTPMSL